MHIKKYRLSDIPLIADVKIKSWRSTYQNLIPNSILDSLSLENEEKNLHELIKTNSSMIGYVVEQDPDEIIGYIFGGSERTSNKEYKGEIYAIYLLSQYQRQGIGRNLFETFSKNLAKQGITSMLVWVLKDSPFRDFYISLGGEEIDYQTYEHECSKLSLVAYGWKQKPC